MRAALKNSPKLRRLIATVIFVIAAYIVSIYDSTPIAPTNSATDYAENHNQVASDQVIADAFKDRKNDLPVRGSGEVIHILPDDNEGSRHQRFLVRLVSGQTLLIAHNIDLAPRISGLSKGDQVEFVGDYEWSDLGGVVHWTHKDPRGHHRDGWIKHLGRTYE